MNDIIGRLNGLTIMDHFKAKRRANWKGRTCWNELAEYVNNETGCKFVELDALVEEHGNATLKRYVTEFLKPCGVYIIRVGGHFVTYHDGVLIDQYEANPVEKFRGVKKRVTNVARIQHPTTAAPRATLFRIASKAVQLELF